MDPGIARAIGRVDRMTKQVMKIIGRILNYRFLKKGWRRRGMRMGQSRKKRGEGGGREGGERRRKSAGGVEKDRSEMILIIPCPFPSKFGHTP